MKGEPKWGRNAITQRVGIYDALFVASDAWTRICEPGGVARRKYCLAASILLLSSSAMACSCPPIASTAESIRLSGLVFSADLERSQRSWAWVARLKIP